MQFVFVVALLATLVALAVAVANYCARRSWLEYRAAAQKRGVKLDWEQWVPKPPTDEENLALTPLFRELDAKGKAAWENFLKLPADAFSSEGDASNGKAADLGPWRQAMLKAKLVDAATTDPAADVLRALERSVGPDLDRLAETLATGAPRLPLNWEGGYLSSAWTSPYLKSFQIQAAKRYQLRSTVRVVRGEGALAAQDMLAILRLGQTLEDQPTLLCGMLRTALTAIAVPGVRRGLAAEVWTDPELRALEEAMSGVDLLSVYRRACGSERAMGNDLVERLLADYSSERQQLIGKLFYGTSSSSLRKRLEGYGWALVPECWFRWNQLIHNQWFDATEARIDPAAGRIYPNRGHVKALADYAQRNEINRLRFWLFNAVALKMKGNDGVVAVIHTWFCQARIAIALERFRLANGSYPQALDQLVPSYLPKLPVDVYTGEPFYYRQTEDGRFVLADSKSAARIRNAATLEQVTAAAKEWDGAVWHYIPTSHKP
ncbi:hypothetical protein ACXR0O_07560 [Verrucomicrobiota bacterium sgz303538]